MQVVNYGPTKIMIVPDNVARAYILDRYGKEEFCDFPFDKTTPLPSAESLKASGRAKHPILPQNAYSLDKVMSNWYISKETRDNWLSRIGEIPGNELNKQIPNLDMVEIDNSIAQVHSCNINSTDDVSKQLLKIIGFNAGRGSYWAEFAEMIEAMPELEKPDLIILNEMDIGMARSRNVHTTKKLAFRLGMNYAWGLEFVELSNGNWEEQNQTSGMENSLGLHGNAILSRCPIYDPMIFRDKLDERYFSHVKFSGNAHGSEKRLGGRMALFVRTGPMKWNESSFKESTTQNVTKIPPAPHVVVGSVHKLGEKTYRKEIWEYLGFGEFPNITKDEEQNKMGECVNNHTLGIVVSGDLSSRKFCTQAGLRNLDLPMKHKTFPASCEEKRLGYWRGDQFCGNMKVSGDDKSILPCYKSQNTIESLNATVQISDHSIIQTFLEMNN